jgi:hypothetical protein
MVVAGSCELTIDRKVARETTIAAAGVRSTVDANDFRHRQNMFAETAMVLRWGAMLSRWYVPIVAVAVVLFAPSTALAEREFGFRGGHVVYAIGGAFAPQQAGLRQNLDIDLALGWYERRGSSIGLLDTNLGTVLAPWAAVGFGKYPTFAGVEYGIGNDATIAGASGAVGPVVRFGSDRFDKGAGLSAHATGDMMTIQAGVRVIAILTYPQEAQFTFTIGFGRF